MILRVETGRVDRVGRSNRIGQVEDRDARSLQARKVGNDVILGHLAALDRYRRHPVHAIQRRLERIGSQFPQIALRYRVACRRQAVTKNRKGREREPIGGDLRRGRQFLLDAADRGVHEFQCLKHVHGPVEEEAHFGGAAAGRRAHGVSGPGTELTASSIGLVMVTCICSTGITPLSTPITTRGKLVSGKTAIGVLKKPKMPTAVRTNATKKMVRTQRGSQKFSLWLRWMGIGRHYSLLPLAAAVIILAANRDLGAVIQTVSTFRHHHVRRRDAAENLDLLGSTQADLDRVLVRRTVAPNHQDSCRAIVGGQNRRGRQLDRVLNRGP